MGFGTVYYAISLFLMVIYTFGIIKKPEIGLCATLIMGYGDGLAAVMGQSIKSYEYKVGKTVKTLVGSATMLVVTGILVSIYLLSFGTPLWYFKAAGISIILTIVEAISIKGTDNLTVPVIACILLSIV